jgi:DNA repair exonuclease SbcCD ATPase subunit
VAKSPVSVAVAKNLKKELRRLQNDIENLETAYRNHQRIADQAREDIIILSVRMNVITKFFYEMDIDLSDIDSNVYAPRRPRGKS